MSKRKHRTSFESEAEDAVRIAKDIKQYADAVRQKSLALRLGRQHVDETMTRMLKPVSTPLQQIEKHTRPQEPAATPVKIEPIILKRRPFQQYTTLTNRTLSSLQPIFTSTPSKPSTVALFGSPTETTVHDDDDDHDDDDEEEKSVAEEDGFDPSSIDTSDLPVQSQAFIAMRLNNADKSVDRVFGPKPNNDGTWSFGNQEIKFLESGNIQVGPRVYSGTQALYHFLFKKTMPASYTDEDVKAYTHILLLTDVHRKGFDPHQPGRSTNTRKYRNIIAPMLRRGAVRIRDESFERGRNETAMSGEGYKLVTDQVKDYVYYSEPNELVDRLRLLVSAEQAGNKLTHHHNEIETILQELREFGIITD